MTGDEKIRANSKILERIAGTFPVGSPEYKALKDSALAFGYAVLTHSEEFEAYVSGLHKPLTQKDSQTKKPPARLEDASEAATVGLRTIELDE